MNEIISDFLAQTFITLPFVSRAAGCVYGLPKDKDTLIPVAPKIYTTNEQNTVSCEVEQDFYDLIPDHREIGILYFEDDMGARLTASNKRYNTWSGELTLVFWGNLKRVGLAYDMSDLEAALMAALPYEVPSSGLFFGGSINWSREIGKNRNPFRKYSYDETRTQYLAPPYGFFSKTVKYTVRAARNCPSSIVLTPIEC